MTTKTVFGTVNVVSNVILVKKIIYDILNFGKFRIRVV